MWFTPRLELKVIWCYEHCNSWCNRKCWKKNNRNFREKQINIENLFLLASKNSEGKKINYNGKEHVVTDLEKFDFSNVKIAFFAAGSGVAEKWAHVAAEKTIVIDNSKYFRKDPDIPLIVPEVNSKNYLM